MGSYLRQGLKEIRSYFYQEAPNRETDIAMWGNKLPQEAYQDRHGESGRSDYDQKLNDVEKQFEPSPSSRDDPGRDSKDLDKE